MRFCWRDSPRGDARIICLPAPLCFPTGLSLCMQKTTKRANRTRKSGLSRKRVIQVKRTMLARNIFHEMEISEAAKEYTGERVRSAFLVCVRARPLRPRLRFSADPRTRFLYLYFVAFQRFSVMYKRHALISLARR